MHKFILLLLFIFSLFSLYSKEIELWSESAIIIDYETEQILFEKDVDKPLPPASMTKLVTIYMAYNFLNNSNIDINSEVEVSSRADWKNLPRDSSLMFIEEGQKVTYKELLIGLAIPSGNDAAIAIAEAVSGSVEQFVIDMNSEMKNLGFKNLYFVEPSGYMDENSITVREFAEFCIIFTKKFPDALNDLFSINNFTYPKKENGNTSIGGIKQFNHNPMIELYPGCDGLKTGFINKSGMNISLTATKSSRRIITVSVGVKDDIKENAELKRIVDSTKLLDFGLNQENIYLDKIKLPLIPVYNGDSSYVNVVIPYKRKITKGHITDISFNKIAVKAPIFVGDKIADVTFKQFGKLYKFPVYSTQNIKQNGPLKTFLNK